MKESIVKNQSFQSIIRLATAVAFTLFTFYQIVLAIMDDTSRVGRLIGIVFYLLITVAAYFDLSEKFGMWIAHSVLLLIGLLALFIIRLFNISAIFGYLDFDNMPSVLNCAVYILSQLGTLLLTVSYLILTIDLTRRQMEKLIAVLMIVVIVIYVTCFVMECVLIIKYRMNVDSTLKFTLISRVLFLLGYIGSAVSMMLPIPNMEEEKTEGEFFYTSEEEDEVDLVI